MDAESKDESDSDDDKDEISEVREGYETYAGASQDTEWMDHTKDIDIKHEQKIYDKLMEWMGHFKWQSSQYV